MKIGISALAGALMAAPALAQPPVCPTPGEARALAPWRIATADKPRVGIATQVALQPAGQVVYEVAPAKPQAPGSYAGLFHFGVAKAGIYRVAVSQPVWIDMVRDARPIASFAHGHGPDCWGIAKIVDFALKPGTQVLQLSGARQPGLTVMIVPAPGN